MKLHARLALIVLTLCSGSVGAMAQSGDPSGLWITQAGDAKVRVSRCGEGICGVVVSLREPTNPATGTPFVDDKNPNPALRRRPIVGLPLFSNMRPAGHGRWAGHIYNADDGGTYDSDISIAGPDTLRVNGCVGALCGGENWTRAGR